MSQAQGVYTWILIKRALGQSACEVPSKHPLECEVGSHLLNSYLDSVLD